MLERRNRLTSHEIAKRSKSIQEFVINSKEFLQAKVVGAYFAFGSEVTTELIITRAKILGKKIALPRVEEEKITFYEPSSMKSLIRGGRFGIMEPPPYGQISEIDILVVLALLLIKRAIALDMVRVTMTDYCRIGEHFLLDLRTRFSCLRIYHMTGMTKGWTQSLAKMPSITPSGLSPFLQYLSCNSGRFLLIVFS